MRVRVASFRPDFRIETVKSDFHLTDSNTIVEIKSEYFYDEQNMKDKFQKYRELGYDCKLILENIEYSEPVTI